MNCVKYHFDTDSVSTTPPAALSMIVLLCSHVVVVANGDFNEHGSIWFTKPLTRVVTHDRAILLRLHRFFQRHGYGGRFNTHAQCTARIISMLYYIILTHTIKVYVLMYTDLRTWSSYRIEISPSSPLSAPMDVCLLYAAAKTAADLRTLSKNDWNCSTPFWWL